MNLQEVFGLDLPAHEKLIFAVLCAAAGEGGEVRMPLAVAARQAGMEEARVAEALQNLIKNNLLRDAPRKNEGLIHCYCSTTSSSSSKTATTTNSSSSNVVFLKKTTTTLDLEMLPPPLRQPAEEMLAQAGLEAALAQDLVDELVGRLARGGIRNPLCYFSGLVRKARAREFFFTQSAARQQRLARHAEPARRAAAPREAAAMPEKYLKDQRVQRLLKLGSAGRETS